VSEGNSKQTGTVKFLSIPPKRRRSISLDTSGPQRMMSGASAIGRECYDPLAMVKIPLLG
jgi:hypothetical protein